MSMRHEANRILAGAGANAPSSLTEAKIPTIVGQLSEIENLIGDVENAQSRLVQAYSRTVDPVPTPVEPSTRAPDQIGHSNSIESRLRDVAGRLRMIARDGHNLATAFDRAL